VVAAPAAALLADYCLMVFQRLWVPRGSQVLQVRFGVVGLEVLGFGTLCGGGLGLV